MLPSRPSSSRNPVGPPGQYLKIPFTASAVTLRLPLLVHYTASRKTLIRLYTRSLLPPLYPASHINIEPSAAHPSLCPPLFSGHIRLVVRPTDIKSSLGHPQPAASRPNARLLTLKTSGSTFGHPTRLHSRATSWQQPTTPDSGSIKMRQESPLFMSTLQVLARQTTSFNLSRRPSKPSLNSQSTLLSSATRKAEMLHGLLPKGKWSNRLTDT